MQKGYGRAADMWSVGVIMYLLLRARLPFHGRDKTDTFDKVNRFMCEIEKTLGGDVYEGAPWFSR
jgi:serine/threonine protein kinase